MHRGARLAGAVRPLLLTEPVRTCEFFLTAPWIGSAKTRLKPFKNKHPLISEQIIDQDVPQTYTLIFPVSRWQRRFFSLSVQPAERRQRFTDEIAYFFMVCWRWNEAAAGSLDSGNRQALETAKTWLRFRSRSKDAPLFVAPRSKLKPSVRYTPTDPGDSNPPSMPPPSGHTFLHTITANRGSVSLLSVFTLPQTFTA
jgi:hypothetical protein